MSNKIDASTVKELAPGQVLRKVLKSVKNPESSAAEAEGRFWAALRKGTTLDDALGAALDGFAPDAESWIKARTDAYKGMIGVDPDADGGGLVEKVVGPVKDAVDAAKRPDK